MHDLTTSIEAATPMVDDDVLLSCQQRIQPFRRHRSPAFEGRFASKLPGPARTRPAPATRVALGSEPLRDLGEMASIYDELLTGSSHADHG
jgi:hypothetical protein